MHHVLIRYTLKAGLQRYKERGEKGVAVEMKQLNYKLTFKTVKNKSLTTEQRADALCSLMLLKEKITGKMKGYMCADGIN